MLLRTLFVALLAVPLQLGAQIRASELGVMSQTIDGTKVTIEYSRPRARGRETLFGTKAVRWGETWTPGANWATTFEATHPVTLNGIQVAKGKYSVWMIVKQTGAWTVVLDPKARRYHMNPPDSSAQQIRFQAKPETIPFTDVLTWSMPALRIDGGTLTMEWERIRIPIEVRVQPSLVMTLPARDASPYVGKYTFTETDSTGKPCKVSSLAITHEGETLRAEFTPEDKYLQKFALIRIAPDWFAAAVYDKSGQIYEVLKPDMVLEFKRAEGRAMSFTIRDGDDNSWGTGLRSR